MCEDNYLRSILEPEFIESLIEDYEIPKELIKRFSAALETYCRRFSERQIDAVQIGSVANQRLAFKKIASQVSALEQFLTDIPLPVKDMMAAANYEMNEEPFSIELEAYEASVELAELAGLHVIYPNENTAFINFSLVLRQLKLIADGAKFVEAVTLTKTKGEPPFRTPLDYWIIDMRSLWSGMLGRSFSRDQQGGEAVSPAARFCVDVFAKLSKDTPKNTVLTSMRNLAEATDRPAYFRNLTRIKLKSANDPKGQ